MSAMGLFIGNIPDVYAIFASISVARMNYRLDQAINFKEAMDLMSERDGRRYEFIVICLPPLEGAPEFLNFLNDSGLELPVLFTADENTLQQVHELLPLHPLTSRICYNMGEKVISNVLRRILKVKEKHVRAKEGYCPLPISFFSRLEKASFNTYIKLSDEKYLLLFRKGLPLDLGRIEQYQKKDCRYLYLKASDYLVASSEIFSNISHRVKPAHLQTSKLISLSKLAGTIVHKAISHLGLKEEVLIIADAGIEATKELVKRVDNRLVEHLKCITSGKDYHAEHTLLAIFIATAIAREIEWEGNITRDKIVYSLFFHDIATDDLELAMAEDPRTHDGVTEKRLKKYLLHPKAAADMLEDVSNLPMDIGRIILLHHEKPDGSGFPYGVGWKKIFPLAAIINVAHELAKLICISGIEEAFIEDVLDDLETLYNKGNYKTAMEGARKAFGIRKIEITETLKNVV
jgi:hypothetical protein